MARTSKKAPRKVVLNTQKDRVRRAILAIAGDVTMEDRKACERALKVSSMTISNYLKGNVLNSDLGLQILTVLRGRIDSREIQLKLLCGQLSKD